MKLGDFETYVVEGVSGGGLKKSGEVIFSPVGNEPSEMKQWKSVIELSLFLRLLHEAKGLPADD